MDYIIAIIAVAMLFALSAGCIQAPTDYSPVNESNPTIVIINYDKYLNPTMIRDALSMAGMPDFIHVNIVQCEGLPAMHTADYWGITSEGPVLPGDDILIIVPYNSCALFKNTQYAGYAAEHCGAVVSSGDVWGSKLGLRIFHEMLHEKGLPADDMVASNFSGTELQYHVWLAENNKEAFNT